MGKNTLLMGIISLLVFCGTTQATTWYVHPDSALNTISAGLNSCADNDTVLVGPGTYHENIGWPAATGICLMSELGPEFTIIDSGEIVVTDYNTSDDRVRIDGFTLQNGGGIFVIQNSAYAVTSTVIITNNVIKYNHTAIWIETESSCEGRSIISSNTVTNNQLGIVFRYDDYYPPLWASITGNFIASNEFGIACWVYDDDRMPIFGPPVNREPWLISRNTITHNDYYGAHLPGNATLRKNTISYNGHLGLFFDPYYDGNVTIDSCVIVGNYGNGITLYNEGSIHNCEIYDNIGYGVRVYSPGFIIDAEYNWWGDSTGPYHPDSNPGGLGDSVSDHVDFIPWLYWPGVEEKPSINPAVKLSTIGATILAGPIQLPVGKMCKIIDITGRIVVPDKIKPGIYFIEVDGVITQKIVKIR